MFKRFLCLVVLIPFILACLPVFYASADEVQSWIIVDYRLSQDGVNWSSRQELQLVDGAFIQDGTYDYFKIDRIRILNTSNKPSDLFISFNLGIHSFNYSSIHGSLGWLSQDQSFTASNQNLSGYFRYRFNGGRFEAPSANYNEGNSMFFVGQYHITDVSDTACTLTPNSDNVGAYFTYSSGYHGIAVSIHNVNVLFVGNDGQLYDINQNLTSLYNVCNSWYGDWFDYFFAFQDYVDFCENTILPFLEDWNVYQLEFLAGIDSNLYDLWSQFYAGSFPYYVFGSQGSNSSIFNSRFASAINSNLMYQNSILNSLNQRGWNYIIFDLNEDNNQMESSQVNGSWFQAILGALSATNAIDEHELALENEALDAGAGDLYDEALSDIGDSYSGLGYLFGLKALRNLFNFSEWSSNSLSIISGWFTQENSNNINGTPGRAPEETIADFVSHNSDLDWFGDHGE